MLQCFRKVEVISMKTVEERLQGFFKWNGRKFLSAILGCLIFAMAVNLFIVPNSLYNGGVLGISQLIRSILEKYFHLHFSFDIAGIINFIINIPLFFMAYK